MDVLLLKPSVGSRHGSVRRRRSKSSEHAQTLRREREAEVLILTNLTVLSFYCRRRR